ncbi:MAG: GumC family protein [Planctomycetales bacterium]
MVSRNPPPPRNPFTYRTPRQFRDLLLRHRRKSAWFFGGTMGVVVAALVLLPRTYVSEAKLFVRLGRESVTLDPTATTGQMVPVHESREAEIGSVLDVLRSRVLLETVVDELGADVVLGMKVQDDAKPQASAAARERDRAIRALEEAIVVTNGKKSSVITVTGKANSPETAQRIVQSFVDAFHSLHIRVNRTEGSHQFFREQANLLTDKLRAARNDLAATKSKYGILTIEGQRKNLQDQISAGESQAHAAEADLASAEATVAQLDTQRAALPERIVSQQVDGHPNAPGDTARQQLFQLEVQQRELLARYTERHPLVIAVREQIEEARTRMVDHDADRTQSTDQVNPARQSVELQLLQEQSRAASLAARARTLRAQQARLQGDLRNLNSQEAEIEQLERRVAILQTEYQAHAERLEQARIDEALETERISNVNVVQPATFISKPAAPKLRVILALGLFVAGVGAIGIAFASEYLAFVAATEAREDAAESAPAASAGNSAFRDESEWWRSPGETRPQPAMSWESRDAAALGR